jgi:CBS domain containing-hemolysin-like protein
VDEFGGTAGIIAMEDLIERVFGELQDEPERQEPADIVRLPNGQALLNGLLLIDDFNNAFNVEIDDPDYDTIGGHVFGRIGRRPRIGDEVAVNGYRLRVVELDGLRIARLRLIPIAQHASPGPGTGSDTTAR